MLLPTLVSLDRRMTRAFFELFTFLFLFSLTLFFFLLYFNHSIIVYFDRRLPYKDMSGSTRDSECERREASKEKKMVIVLIEWCSAINENIKKNRKTKVCLSVKSS